MALLLAVSADDGGIGNHHAARPRAMTIRATLQAVAVEHVFALALALPLQHGGDVHSDCVVMGQAAEVVFTPALQEALRRVLEQGVAASEVDRR
eukprot:1964741-Heterocapsa_arctica.AAC.1